MQPHNDNSTGIKRRCIFGGAKCGQGCAYIRNSPIYHATNVKTPLMILHNAKDGSVDQTQGIEYYNTLRRMGKASKGSN